MSNLKDQSLEVLSKDVDAVGVDKYRGTDSSTPLAFRPTSTITVRPNPDGSNHNVTVETIYPIVVVIDGVPTSKNAFKAVTKFSALQHITNDEEREACMLIHQRVINAAQEDILEGRLPRQVLTLTVA